LLNLRLRLQYFMNRRKFLETGAGTVLASMVSRLAAAAQGASASGTERVVGQAAPVKLKVDAYSRHLQWLRTADEVAEAAIEMGYEGVDLTVRPYPGHVNPENVAQELPPFVNTIRKHGLLVRTITANITDADSPHAEQIISTASGLGITHYWWGTFRYEPGKPVFAQLEALKPRVAGLAALSRKYHMTAMYHTYSRPQAVGSVMWDLLHVLKEFDPAHVGFHYDAGHQAHHLNGLWEMNLRAAGPYIAGLAVKDFRPEQDLGLLGGGGPYPGPAGASQRQSRQPSPDAGAREGQDAAPVASSAGASASRAGAPQAGRRSGRGRGGPAGNGRASSDAGPVDWAAGNGWRSVQVPLGTGVVDLPHLAQVLKEINFSGPAEIQAEYSNGGAESAQDKISLPRMQVLGAMKRDLLTLRHGFAASGLL
jgi:sugar phosphate isomerase/epimerase